MVNSFEAILALPFGSMGIRTHQDWVVAVQFLSHFENTNHIKPKNKLATKVCEQLLAYVENPHFIFDLPLQPMRTPHQKKVLETLKNIPCGEQRTYGELAKLLDSSPRAIGQACGGNPFAIVIPCHRVVASHGKIGGFMNGKMSQWLAVKQWLLEHEKI